MDYSSVNSELIESLDFLRPPVKRNFRNTCKAAFSSFNNQTNNTQTLEDYCYKTSTGTQHPLNIRGAESSTSLISNRTSNKILEQYSILSYTNLLYSKPKPTIRRSQSPKQGEKPMIRVTVYPKATQTANVVRKPKHLAKKIQATVSNHESVTNTKNIYLVVPTGKKKERNIYQIKNTGSAKFAQAYNRYKDEVIAINQLSSLKLVLDSLNMEKKKDKNKKRRKKPQESLEGLEPETSPVKDKSCECALRAYENGEETSQDVDDRKSYVRITGRFGLDDEERYVLRCDATVNDQPVATDFTELKNFLPIVRREQRLSARREERPFGSREERRSQNMCDVNTCTTRCCKNNPTFNFCTQRDCNIQTDIEMDNVCCMFPKRTGRMCSKETQATQLDFNSGLSCDLFKPKNMFPYKNEIVQCRCANIESPASPSDSSSDANSAKGCQSPFVIISVYPIPGSEKQTEMQQTIVEDQQKENRNSLSWKASPCCCTRNVRQHPYSENNNARERKNDTKIVRPRSRSPSPNRNQNRNSNKPIAAELKTTTTRSRKSSPEQDATTIMNLRQTKTIKGKYTSRTLNRDVVRNKSPPRSSPHVKDTKGTNTDHNITKKIIVDNYTKKLTAYMDNQVDKKHFTPRKEGSKIKVDIDGCNERYDLCFEHDNTTTGVKVKKTMKGSHKNSDNFMDLFSPMRTSLNVPDEPRRKSQASKNEQSNENPPLNAKLSRLYVRDSLELSHSHDIKTNTKRVGVMKITKNNDDSSEPFSAPIKHYRGDNCSIVDPVQRDKEIRSLLGVEKGVNASTARDVKVGKRKYAVPVHCFYNRTCEKKVVTGINVVEVPPCVCCDIRKNYGDDAKNDPFDCDIKKNASGAVKKKSSGDIRKKSSGIMRKNSSGNIKKNSSAVMKKNSSGNMIKNPSEHSQHIKPTRQSRLSRQAHPSQGSRASKQHLDESPPPEPESEESPNEYSDETPPEENVARKSIKSKVSKTRSKSIPNNTGTQYETQVQRTSLYQQLILNRNIQVFLQVEQFSKQRPIVLSRKQYDKVKRTIENTVSNKTGRGERKKCICRTSVVSVGDVRKKSRKTDQIMNIDVESPMTNDDIVDQITKKSFESKHQTGKDLGLVSRKSSSSNKSVRILERPCACDAKELIMFSKETKTGPSRALNVKPSPLPRQTVSSIELRYATVDYIKHVTFSSTNVEVGSSIAGLQQKESHSIHTIFKGHRRCHTPNLGTSMYSLCSEELKPKAAATPVESKKKPFLRRLMSCLVMRSTRVSEMNNLLGPAPKIPTVESSIDSYHISTSLGAIEVTSSIYDTSASFYTNHSIYPITSKTKRGFFSSVREFLSIRKS